MRHTIKPYTIRKSGGEWKKEAMKVSGWLIAVEIIKVVIALLIIAFVFSI